MKRITALIISMIFIASLIPDTISANDLPTYSLAKQQVADYMEQAKALYASNTDYTESLAPDLYYSISADAECDRPNPVKLTWNGLPGAQSYTLYISTSENFDTNNTLVYENISATSYEVYHLFVNTLYYWKAVGNNGASTPVGSFKTDNTIRFIDVDGMRNVRDIGGWNGLNQGLVYRGCEINAVTQNSDGTYFAATEAGKKTMLEDMKIKTDLDLRGMGDDSGNITQSPLGDTVNWVSNGLGSYISCLKEENMYKFKNALRVFANSDNYPIYFHCYGGADRTGTIAFLVEALAGASEVDLSIDFEATTFSHKVGYRRRNHESDIRALVVTGNNGDGVKTYKPFREYEGTNINEHVESYVRHIGLNTQEISNIKSILAGNGVTFFSTDDVSTGNNVAVTLKNLGTHTVKSITNSNGEVDFNLNGNVLIANIDKEDTYKITFDDDTTLSFDALTPVYPEITLSKNVESSESKRIECEHLVATNSNDGVTGVVNKDGKRIGLPNSRYGEWIINVDEAGIYNLSLIANTNYTGAQVKLSLIEGDTVCDIGTVDLVCDGQHQDCITYPMTTVLPAVNFKSGENRIRLTIISSGTVSMDCINYNLSSKIANKIDGGIYSIKADLSAMGEGLQNNVTLFAGVFNGNTLEKAYIKDVANGTAAINEIETIEGDTLKVFVWVKGSLIPLMPNIDY